MGNSGGSPLGSNEAGIYRNRIEYLDYQGATQAGTWRGIESTGPDLFLVRNFFARLASCLECCGTFYSTKHTLMPRC